MDAGRGGELALNEWLLEQLRTDVFAEEMVEKCIATHAAQFEH